MYCKKPTDGWTKDSNYFTYPQYKNDFLNCALKCGDIVSISSRWNPWFIQYM